MGGGGKGGSKETTVELPPELETGSAGAIGAAMQSAALPYKPNRGVTIAGFSPQQEAVFDGTNAAAAAFGLPIAQGNYLPEMETGAGGVKGYSTGALFDENVDKSMTEEDIIAREKLLENYGMIGDQVLSMERLGGLPLNKAGK